MRNDNFEQLLLSRAASTIAYPATPALRARIVARIATQGTARRAPLAVPTNVRPFAAAAAAVAIAALALSLAIPMSRSALAEFFGIEGERIERLPTPAPGTTPTPFPTPQGIESIATPFTLAEAATRLGFAPALPDGAGAPDGVYLLSLPEAVVVLQYPRFDLWQSKTIGFFGKGLPAEALLREFLIGGEPAAWISGGNHIVTFIDARGTPVVASQRTVSRNTLVWSTNYANYRLETDLSEAEAIAIAEQLP